MKLYLRDTVAQSDKNFWDRSVIILYPFRRVCFGFLLDHRSWKSTSKWTVNGRIMLLTHTEKALDLLREDGKKNPKILVWFYQADKTANENRPCREKPNQENQQLSPSSWQRWENVRRYNQYRKRASLSQTLCFLGTMKTWIRGY